MSDKKIKKKRGGGGRKPGQRFGGRKRTLEHPVQLGVLIDLSDREWLKEQAGREGISQGLLVRRLIATYKDHTKSWVSNVSAQTEEIAAQTEEKKSAPESSLTKIQPRCRE